MFAVFALFATYLLVVVRNLTSEYLRKLFVLQLKSNQYK